MILTQAHIRNKGIIINGTTSNYKDTTYDLRVGEIYVKPIDKKWWQFSSNQSGWVKRYTIPPQGIVYVVSKEELNLPQNISGLASIKTSVSRQGLLAINTGIIDPGYNNYISSILLNFGKDSFHLKEDQIFLRLSFFEESTSPLVTPPINHQPSPSSKYEDYKSDIEAISDDHLSDDFLDNSNVIDRIVDKASNNFRNTSFALFGIFIAVIALIPAALDWVYDDIRSFRSPKQIELDSLKVKIQNLEKAIRVIEKQSIPDSSVQNRIDTIKVNRNSN